MTRLPTTRPASSPLGKPADSGRTGGGQVPGVTIDPLRLLRKYKYLLAASVVVGGIVGVAGYFLLLKFFPQYTAVVIFECEAAGKTVDDPDVDSIDKEEMDRFMRTEWSRMTSERVLLDVIEDPRLPQEAPNWVRPLMRGASIDTAEALKKLDDDIGASIIPETNWIRLTASYYKRDDAVGLARLVRENYKRRFDRDFNANVRNSKDQIGRSITELDREITSLRAESASIVQESGVDSISEAHSGKRHELELVTASLVEIQSEIEAYQSQISQDEAMLASDAGIVYDNALRADVERDPLIASLKQDIVSSEAELRRLMLQGIAINHRTTKSLQARIDGLNQRLADLREEKLRQNFDARLDSYRQLVRQRRAQEADLLTKAEELRGQLNDLTRTLGELEDIESKIQQAIVRKASDKARLADLTQNTTTTRVFVYQEERRPDSVSFPKIKIILPLSVLLVTGLVSGLVVLREVLDQRIKSASDVAVIPRARVLGVIPDAAEDPTGISEIETVFRDKPDGVIAESYRNVRVGLIKAMQAHDHRSLLIVGGMPGSGASSVTTNIAFAAAAAERRVLIIDANFRRPTIHRVLGLGERPGLGDVLANETSHEAAVARVDDGVDVLTAGSARLRRFEQLSSEAMSTVLADATDRYDFVLVDTAPMVVSGDAHALASRCDAALLVVRAFGEKRGMVARLYNELSDHRAELIGVLVNAVRSTAGGYMRANIRTSHDYQNGGAAQAGARAKDKPTGDKTTDEAA